MEHANQFLLETQRSDRQKFRELIIATRVAGADEKGYTKFMNRLKSQERAAKRAEGQQGVKHQMRTYEEETWMAAREHVKFNEMSAEEQSKLTAERESLWGQIPAHLQDKARKLAGR